MYAGASDADIATTTAHSAVGLVDAHRQAALDAHREVDERLQDRGGAQAAVVERLEHLVAVAGRAQLHLDAAEVVAHALVVHLEAVVLAQRALDLCGGGVPVDLVRQLLQRDLLELVQLRLAEVDAQVAAHRAGRAPAGARVQRLDQRRVYVVQQQRAGRLPDRVPGGVLGGRDGDLRVADARRADRGQAAVRVARGGRAAVGGVQLAADLEAPELRRDL